MTLPDLACRLHARSSRLSNLKTGSASPVRPSTLSAALLLAIASLTGCGSGVPDQAQADQATAAEPASDIAYTATEPGTKAALYASTRQIVRPSLIRIGAGGLPTLVTTTPPLQAPNQLGLGANLAPIYDWMNTHEFVDLLRQGRPFGPAGTPWSSALAVGADGWPTQDFGVVLMAAQSKTKGLGGIYQISFTGTATVSLNASPGSLGTPRYDAATGITRIDYTFPEGGDQMILDFRNTNGTVKNLKVIRPGYDATNPPTFTTQFLQHIQRFDVLRTMDWQLTNANELVRWADRPTPTNTRTTSRYNYGVALETIVELANTTRKDIWIHVPFGADDDYVRNMATLLRDTLNSSSKVYIEYSNELWNYGFKQANDNLAAAVAEVTANPSSPLTVGNQTDRYYWAYRRVAKRLIEIGTIFGDVWGASAINTRIRPVLAMQMHGPYQIDTALKMIELAYPKKPADYVYAIAAAPYHNLDISWYGGSNLQTAEGSTVDQILDALAKTAKGEVGPQNMNTEEMVWMARWHGLKFMTYEGGPDTFGAGSIANKRLATLNARMYDICTSYLADWQLAGGDTFMWFYAGAGSYSTQYGSFPVTEDMTEYSPKLRCLDNYRAGRPAVTQSRHIAPVIFDASNIAGRKGFTNAKNMYTSGQSYAYMFSVPTASNYNISLYTGIAAGQFEVWIDGKLAGTIQTVKTTPENWWGWPNGNPPPIVESPKLNVKLTAGVHALKLVFKTNGVNTRLDRISVMP